MPGVLSSPCVNTVSLAGVTSMTRWLNWSLMRVLPLARRTARVGSGAELLPNSVLVRYSHTGCVRGIDLDDAIVVRIRDQSVAVAQPAGERRAADRASRGELPHELPGRRHFDDAVVVLVGDQDMTVLEQFGAVRVVELISSRPRHERHAVLPDDLAPEIHQNDP